MGETPQEIEAKAMNLLSAFHDRGGFILSSGCEIPPESTPENPEAAVEVVSPFAGFVGSDLLAGVLATHLTDRPGGLLIDFGTNSELALWDGTTLWVTSAAGGPAFEGCGIQCGMPAEPGAIYRIDPQQEATGLRFQVIGDGLARGLCGSGLVDLIAFLRRTGDLTSTGKLTIPYPENVFIVQRENPAIRLTNGDVDIFQRAKARWTGTWHQTSLRFV